MDAPRGHATDHADPRFHHVGLGVVHADGFYWVTLQVFD
jgi:hypothetical protein